ncbi:hypothetical protein P8C59_007641 [Phyllachora maydis]|uniref:Chromosome segregation in meiosis protein n=1 Tax=Phyllachora maydis TaxID=1825666 RepID=A0AAD9MEE7_9PEZI|nr:hypothetical protein P8C59_007641 [Phyllachora maydis]
MPAKATARATRNEEDWDRFLEEWDEIDSFADPAERDGAQADAEKASQSQQSRKRKSPEPDGLGVDKELDLKKKPRAPRARLDEARLLSAKGIPKLRQKAQSLKFKGKGHEFSDAARLLSFYQLWLDDLFPKARFLDALAMVEKAGHKTIMHKKRMEWIDEYKPKPSVEGGEAEPHLTRVAPAQEAAPRKTPDDLFEDDDIYDATPRKKPTGPERDAPDNDDMDALMAMEDHVMSAPKETKPTAAASSIFGGPLMSGAVPDPDDEVDLDALMAEAEAGTVAKAMDKAGHSGVGKRPVSIAVIDDDDDDDLDALMAEAEAAEQTGGVQDGEEELDARIAEVEAAFASNAPQAQAVQTAQPDRFSAEEEVMAEMDGLCRPAWACADWACQDDEAGGSELDAWQPKALSRMGGMMDEYVAQKEKADAVRRGMCLHPNSPSHSHGPTPTAIMQFLALVAAAGTFVAPALAQQAIVNNMCAETVYVQSWPFENGSPGPLTTLTTGQQFSENLRPVGSAIKLALDKNLDTPLFASYSFSTDLGITYYEFSRQYGNPFLASHNTYSAGDGCPAFDCAANNATCYSAGGGQTVEQCPSPVILEVTLCAS